MFRYLAMFSLISVLFSCGPHTSVDEYGRVVVHNVGYVRIIKPPVIPTNKEINVTGYKVLGFSIENGFTVGYKAEEYMKIPTDCRVLVIVKDKSQLEHLFKEFSLIGENELCATVSAK